MYGAAEFVAQIMQGIETQRTQLHDTQSVTVADDAIKQLKEVK
jgi:hypothetical protein